MFKYLLYFLSSVVILANGSSKSTQLFNQANEIIAKYNGEVNGLKKAREILSQLIRINPQSADTLLIKGKLIFQDGYISHDDYQKEYIGKAKNLCYKVIKNHPQRIDSYILLASLFMNDGTDVGLNKAKVSLDSADLINEKHIRLKLAHAQLQSKYKNNAEVIRLSNEVLVLNPKTWEEAFAYSFLTLAYWRLKDFDKSKSAYLKIIELEPSSPWALINYSSFLRKRKDFDGAISYAKKSLELANYGMGWSVLSKAYYAKGHYLYWGNKDKINSKKWFQMCVDINPNSLNCHYGLGSSYFYTGWINHSVEDIKRSQKEYNECQRINPRHESSVKELKRIEKLLKRLGVH